MNCKDFYDCVCEVIDKRLSEERTKELLQHADVCPRCKFELQALQTSKNILHSKVHRQSVPADVYYAIVNNTVRASGATQFLKLIAAKINPAIAVVALLVIAVGIYSAFFTSSTIADDSNIINQSLANYQAALGGTLQPELVSNYDEVRTFLEKEVSFAVNVPKVKKCKSFSGRCSDFKGIKLAHVAFQLNGSTIYIYQANMDEAMNGKKITLPSEAKDELRKSKWYIKELPDNKTVVLWKYKETLCAAVSDMKKDQLVALLSDKDHQ